MIDTVNIRFPRRLHKAAKVAAMERNMSLQEFLENCVTVGVNRSKPVVVDRIAERASKMSDHRSIIELLLDLLELNPSGPLRTGLVEYLKGLVSICRAMKAGEK